MSDLPPADEPSVDAVIGRRGLQPKGIARRQEILDRAIEVFRERGADGTSLRKIAEAIGVSHAALLHYFDSREQLLIAVYAHAEHRRGDKPGSTPGVETMIDAAIANVEVPGLVTLYTTLLAASLEADSTLGRDYFGARFARLRSRLTQSLLDQQQRGEVRDDVSAEHLAALIIAASDGLQVQWLIEPSVGLESTLRTLGELLKPRR
ncbi:TetR/AcrR family transcriptional regulator [Microbacterium sp. EYE_5]|uniref:TetR/AcrR family transcriptional regulator n=1 Tax=unclassified Microbacterium TaxID=2609290 RepID=UPI0020038393|nr:MULTISPECIES: TetR/AcrR family transcriptional regulator [unclassified Microbacterium]MCK6080187.1 TetR/AcrR family transcriptional regulator [Microbacterium sp. EYE_382]MCK6085458.1 TetR/AcrR family transcriptional regulator [Microbacterium sp. EYE_384]MCK6122317.1 TetR/AcrR family transcriptional regulator [Microbacterium sp. EYE_80]MCK6126221.1 TetR/AcrR family transcriptional regulator [Microbacterium sp. EYE_79]MCK6141142.1 TetR/AcrR family transcriptional regulator [Microbacterium sp.